MKERMSQGVLTVLGRCQQVEETDKEPGVGFPASPGDGAGWCPVRGPFRGHLLCLYNRMARSGPASARTEALGRASGGGFLARKGPPRHLVCTLGPAGHASLFHR